MLVWLTYALITFNWVSTAWGNYLVGLFVTVRIISLHAFVFYINVYLLLPKLMDKNKYVLYLFSILLLLVVVYFARELLEYPKPGFRPEHFEEFRGNPSLMKAPPEEFNRKNPFFRINPRVVMDIITSVAILFISTTFWLAQQAGKRQKEEANLKNENLNTELKLLKSQINPHFLFNALNNIYSLSFTQEKRAPDMIMKLSDMLRYVLYESNESKVTLEKEIEYINNYIDFQKVKSEGDTNINVDIDVDMSSLLVEPMLFIPFIENSFKHSNIESNNGWVKMKLTTKENDIIFEISNSKPRKVYSKDLTKGIGLENVKKRLQLLYPNLHDLFIEETSDLFNVKLVIHT